MPVSNTRPPDRGNAAHVQGNARLERPPLPLPRPRLFLPYTSLLTFTLNIDSVSEVGLGKVPTGGKAFELGDVLSLPIFVFVLNFGLFSGRGGDAVDLHATAGSDGLCSLTEHAGDTKFEDGDLTTPVQTDTSF